MSTAGVRQTFTIDATDFENKMAQMQASILKLKERLAEMAQQQKHGADDALKAIREQTKELVSMAMGATGVLELIRAIGAAQKELNQKQREYNDLAKDLGSRQVQGTFRAGMAGSAQQIEQYIQGAVGRGVGREDAMAALFGVAAGGPAMSQERKFALARQVERTEPLFAGDRAGMQEFGTAVGRAGDIFAQSSPQAIASLVAAAYAKAGKDAEQLISRRFLNGMRTLAESGAMAPEQTMALGVWGLQHDLSAMTLAELGDKITAPKEVLRRRAKHLTEKQKLEAEFAAASPQKRLEMIQGSEAARSAVLGSAAGKVGQVDWAAVGSLRDEFVKAQKGDYIAETGGRLEATKAGKLTATLRAQEVFGQESGLRDSGDNWAYLRNDLDKFLEIELRRRQASPLEVLSTKTMLEANLTAHQDMPWLFNWRSLSPWAKVPYGGLGETLPEAGANALRQLGPFDREMMQRWMDYEAGKVDKLIDAVKSKAASDAAHAAAANSR